MKDKLNTEALKKTMMREFAGDYREFYFEWCRDISGWTDTPDNLDRLKWDHPVIKEALASSLSNGDDTEARKNEANQRLQAAVQRFVEEERRVMLATSEALDRLTETMSRCRLDPGIVNVSWNDWRVPRFRLEEYFDLMRIHVDEVIFAGRSGWHMFLDDDWESPVECRLAAIISVIRYYQLQDLQLLNTMARAAAGTQPPPATDDVLHPDLSDAADCIHPPEISIPQSQCIMKSHLN